VRAWLVGNKVIRSSADKRQIAGRQLKGIAVPVRPEPGVALDHRMNSKLDGSREPEPPWRNRNGPGEHSSRRARSDQMLLKDVHPMSVLHKGMSVKIIEPLTSLHDHGWVNNIVNRHVLVLGATGKTGSRVASKLSEQGVSVRTAARGGADIHFDWDNPATFEGALQGITGVYLVSPVMRTDFAGVVSGFLDQAEQAGVRHVTCLSAYGMEHAPAGVALRAVELDLMSRSSLTHSIIRPAWFMQNFSETFLKPAGDEIVVPAGTGAEAFVSAGDIASVAAATLAEPGRHAGAAYAPTGPESLTLGEAARIISAAAGRTIAYRDTDRNEWVDAMVRSGVPAKYGEVLRTLTETIASGRGSQPNGDVLAATGAAPVSFAGFAAKAAPVWK
jgi:uncharacterized protein YbjT (DUF2867 family)